MIIIKEIKCCVSQNENSLEILERVYKLIKIGEFVKYNGKVYMRIRPKNNMYYKYPYHFKVISDNIYVGNVLMRDSDDESVNTICDYKIVLDSNLNF